MDAFERAYAKSVLREDPEPTPPRPQAGGGPLRAGVAASAPFSLHGCVLTPDQRLDDAWVDIDGSRVTRVGTAPPAAGVTRLETDGIILPGLVDLHGHPEYNVFAAWEPPKLYLNRGQWRDSKEYAKVVKEPVAALKTAPSLERTLARYAEARALVTGTTSIQGSNGKFTTIEEALVRNVDRRIFGLHKARSIVDLDRTPAADRAALRAKIDAGTVNAVYVHLAEGTDPGSRAELADLEGSNLLTPATIIIHGTALTEADLDRVAASGAKLVWSPQSNLRLYGTTTLAGAARARGIPLALGADWLPSGSPSLLAELKVARRCLELEGTPATAKELVRMVTADAAAIAGLADHLGLLAAGRPADVLVLDRVHPDPWESVALAEPSAVGLVVLGGDVAYGRAEWVRTLAGTPDGAPDPGATERAIAWGRPMLVDTSYSVKKPKSEPPKLAGLRAELIARYPQVGPIFA
jgi:5-methylthioadenosine/S-adenosylhomocysteine deaminase